jgi:hypothetical protein
MDPARKRALVEDALSGARAPFSAHINAMERSTDPRRVVKLT